MNIALPDMNLGRLPLKMTLQHWPSSVRRHLKRSCQRLRKNDPDAKTHLKERSKTNIKNCDRKRKEPNEGMQRGGIKKTVLTVAVVASSKAKGEILMVNKWQKR
jgi:hypothetical protein